MILNIALTVELWIKRHLKHSLKQTVIRITAQLYRNVPAGSILHQITWPTSVKAQTLKVIAAFAESSALYIRAVFLKTNINPFPVLTKWRIMLQAYLQ